MKGFKPTGYGPSSGFKFPASMGFTGSTGAYTNVQPYVRRRAFKDGGYVVKIVGDTGSALVRRARPYTNEDQESGGKTPLRPGFKDGGKNWIKGAIKHPGALHAALGVPEGQKIPAKKMAKAAHSKSPTMRKRAALAKTLGKMHKADGGQVSPSETRDKDIENLRKNALSLARDRDFAAQDLKANSYPFTPPGVQGFYKDIADERRTRFENYKGSPRLDESWRHKSHSLPKKPATASGAIKGKFAADGGVVRGSSAKPFLESLGDLPALAREGVDYIKRSMSSGRRSVGEQGRSVMEETDSDVTGKTTASNYSRGGKMRRMGYAKGGGVSRDEAKKIAQSTIGEHVRYPAPKGHKGLGAMIKR